MAELNRRNFIKAAGGAVAVIAAAGAARASAVVPDKWDVETDILVVGAGVAGLFAAVSAKENGAERVLLIDKNATPFLNASSFSAGMVVGSGTKAQAAAGIKDENGKAEFVEEYLKGGRGTGRRELVEVLAREAPAALDWMTDRGVKLIPVVSTAFRVNRQYYVDTNSGSRYVKILYEEGRKLGVEYRMNTKALELVTTPDGSQVLGLKAETKGKPLAIRADRIIMCTGGFAANTAMLDDNLLSFRGILSTAAVCSVGEGLKMVRRIGGDTTHLDQATLVAYGLPTDEKKRRALIWHGHKMGQYGTITLGEDGRRFIRDEAEYTDVALAMAQLGFKKVFQIATDAQLKDFMAHDDIQVIGWGRERFEEELRDRKLFVKKADTIEDLAVQMGLPADAVAATVRAYNSYVDAGRDKEFDRKYIKGDFRTGPYWGFICRPLVSLTMGGVRIDPRLHVLDVYGNPIKGLYAAGEIVGGIHGSCYIGGGSVGSSLTFGKFAGKVAATEA
ncbi:FAD-dependent oxidoreductase [uncultured Sutterella sp.]|uniref:FAD-dependent oxidoreductase n=1 Tax=uncultured Sutterella sp. TaxID=286133 RepID=UPI002609005D|nr:FAD-dependent oxidoreductase [uncultured Sutterella sp.]